jgi:hypothetical protein
LAATALPLLVLGFDAQRLESRIPELFEERPQFSEALGPDAVQPPSTVSSLGDQAGVTEDSQVLRDRRPGDVGKVTGDRAGSQFLALNEQKDLAAARFSDGIEERLHFTAT